MSQENYDKTIQIYETLSTLLVNADHVLKLSMKYVPISTQTGRDLHKEYDALVSEINKLCK